jgi:hypothetical protein
MIVAFVSCEQPINKPADQFISPITVTPEAVENNDKPPPSQAEQAKPDKSFVSISDRIGSRDPKFSSCEYYISVQNKHSAWSLKDVAVDINGTIYKITDFVGPNSTFEFNKSGLPCPQSSYHVYYQWQPPR